jgi:hypothetical protein
MVHGQGAVRKCRPVHARMLRLATRRASMLDTRISQPYARTVCPLSLKCVADIHFFSRHVRPTRTTLPPHKRACAEYLAHQAPLIVDQTALHTCHPCRREGRVRACEGGADLAIYAGDQALD